MDLSKKKAVVVDHGFFLEVALRLARELDTVYYVDPSWETAQPKVDHAITGVGFPGVQRVKEVWDVIDQVDVAVFPDTLHSGMQRVIESMGVPVWGARTADNLEIKKLWFKRLQKELGLNFAEYDVVNGIDALRDYCMDPANIGRWIKMSPQFRGNKETFQNRGWPESKPDLDEMSLAMDVVGDMLRFICEKPIKAKVEGGLDTYTVDGAHPGTAVSGFEIKDRCYFAAVQKWNDIPEEIRCVCEPLWPILKERRCRQMLSTEVKVNEHGQSILLEPTVRFPSPAGEEQMELYENFPEIIVRGASGELVEPALAGRYACEAMIAHKGDEECVRSLKVPDEVRRWVKLYSAAKVGDRIAITPGQEIIGAVVGIGNSPKDCLEHLKENARELEDEPVTIDVESLAKAIEEIEDFESMGMHFTSKPMPKAEEAITG